MTKKIAEQIKERKKKEINRKNRLLRIYDQTYSDLIMSQYRQKGSLAAQFDKLFLNEKDCEKKMLEFQGWDESEDKSDKERIVLKFQCDGVDKGKACISQEAVRIERSDKIIQKNEKDELSLVKDNARTIYQCSKCRRQFNLYKDTIFLNRKGTDLWVWFLCLHTMFLLDGKIPSTWLQKRYLNYLHKLDGYISNEEERRKLQRKVVEQIRRITRRIHVELFKADADPNVALRYKNMFFKHTAVLCPTYSERLSFRLDKGWKIAIREKSNKKTIKLSKFMETNKIKSVHQIQLFDDFNICNVGDWVLILEKDNAEKYDYKFDWMKIDRIEIAKSWEKWQAIQFDSLAESNYVPFIITDQLKRDFISSIKECEEKYKKLPRGTIFKTPYELNTLLEYNMK